MTKYVFVSEPQLKTVKLSNKEGMFTTSTSCGAVKYEFDQTTKIVALNIDNMCFVTEDLVELRDFITGLIDHLEK